MIRKFVNGAEEKFQKGRSRANRMRKDFLLTRLMMRVYWFDDALQAALKSAGWPKISRAQSMLFVNIGAGERRPTRLAENLGVSRQSIGQMIGELEDRGILRIEPDPDDRRARLVFISPQAEPLVAAASAVLEDLENELGRRLGKSKMRGLKSALEADWGSAPMIRLINQLPPSWMSDVGNED